MFWVVLLAASLIAGAVFRWKRRSVPILQQVPSLPVYAVLSVVALFSVFQTSTVNPGGSQFAQFVRIYFCKEITDGRNVALPGECGRQAEIVMPGFQFSFLVNVLNDVTYHEMLDVADGHYALLNARDGLKMDEGQVAAKPWALGIITMMTKAADGKLIPLTTKGSDGKDIEVKGNMLDATFFLTKGQGRKGPQTTVLPPGRYALNNFLWDVTVDQAVESTDKKKTLTSKYVRRTIQPGHVGVIKSAIDSDVVPAFMPDAGKSIDCGAHVAEEKTLGQIKAVLVPVGCRGVWKDTLHPGDYFINERVYQVTEVDTRVQNWTFQGGYKRRYINLSISDNGQITQQVVLDDVDLPLGGAGGAIAVKVEGWTVYQDVRLQARALPEYAALVVAAVGGLKEVEDRIIVPQVSSVLRDVGGSRISVSNTAAYEEAKSELDALKARLEILKDSNTEVGLSAEQRAVEVAQLERQIAGIRLPDPNTTVTRPTRVLDFQNERAALQKLVAADIQLIGKGAGIEIVNVTFGNADIPAELLVSRKIEQLSGQMRNAYLQQRVAQVQRQATESARARADQQKDLVTAAVKVETSKLGIESRTNDGKAEQAYLEALAKGQLAQANVLGPDRVLMFNLVQEVLKHPDAIGALKLPSTLTLGQGGGLTDMATILGATKLFGGPATAAPPTTR